MINQNIDIFILYNENFSDSIFETFDQNMNSLNANYKKEKIPDRGPMAMSELHVPTAVILFITSAIFSGILTELGKDIYLGLKKSVIGLYEELIKKDRVKLVGTKGKINDKYPYSFTFSIHIGEKNNKKFKLLFPKEMQKQEYEEVIEKYLSAFIEYYNPEIEDEITQLTLQTKMMNDTYFLSYDSEKKTIELIIPDYMKRIQEYKNR